MGHIVFGGNDRRVFTRLRKARAFVAVYPLFERGHAPRFRVVEIVVQCADRLCKGYYQCPVICCILFHRSSIYCFYYSTIYPVLLGTPPMSGRRRRTIRRPCRGSRIDKAFFLRGERVRVKYSWRSSAVRQTDTPFTVILFFIVVIF